jgi:hypothetical protein
MFARRTFCVAAGCGLLLLALPAVLRADSGYGNSNLSFLPPSISDGLSVDFWAWYSYLHSSDSDAPNYWDGQFAAEATKSFSGNLALTAEMSFIDDNDDIHGQLEQAYLGVVLSKNANSFLTVGKFNANFGVEARDFWNQQDGTTSLLFSAMPQDLLGAMITYPMPGTHLKIEPFIATGFTGSVDMPRPPSGGLTLDDQPNPLWDFAVTQWIGPGYEKRYSEADDNAGGPVYGYPYPYSPPASTGGDSSYYRGSADVVSNWNGPDLYANEGGLLYVGVAKAVWTPRSDFTLAGEVLIANNSSEYGTNGWDGVTILANYNVTDKFRLFGRGSLIDDSAGIVTGQPQHRQELSGGAAYEVLKNAEVRGEYRHDFSHNTGNLDTFSINLTIGV